MANDGVIQITTKIGIEGEREYKKALQDIAQEQKILKSKANELKATYEKNADSLEALTAKDKQLRDEYALMQKKMETLSQAYQNAAENISDGGKKAAEYEIQMNNLRASMIRQEHAIDDTAAAIGKLKADTDKSGESISKLRNDALDKLEGSLQELTGKLKLNAAEYKNDAKSVEALTQKGKLLEQQHEVQRRKVELLTEAYEKSKSEHGALDKETQKLNKTMIDAQVAWQETKNAIADNSAALEAALNPTEELTEATEELEVKSGGLGDQLSGLAEKIGITLPASAQKYKEALNAVDAGTVALVGTSVKLVKGLIDCSVAAAQNADNLLTLSITTGLTTERLQELQYASELIDVSVDQIADAIKDMINTMRDAAKGTGDAAEAYKKLGVRVTKANGQLRDSNDVFVEVIDRLSHIKNPTERAALAMQIFGDNAIRLNPIIEDGGKKLKQLSQEAHNVGYVMSDETVQSLGALDDAMQRFDKTSEAVKNQMALALLPVLTGVLDIITAIPPGVLSTVAVAVTLITTIAAAAKALKSITAITSLFGISATKTLGTILAVVAALIALSAIIAVIAGKGNDLNRAMAGIGNAVGSVQGNVQKAQKTIPRYASGTDWHPGGWALVGENGPEAVMLPRGTRVYTAQETARMGGGDVYNISINADNVKQFVDIVRIAQSERRSMRMG